MIDPHNGQTAEGITRATVVAKNAIDADALSTAVYMLGTNRGMEFIERISGVEALILTKNGERLHTSGWSEIARFKN
jgi:thiamine biosynthesis lipoprotein